MRFAGGHFRTSANVTAMSAFLPLATNEWTSLEVRFVPTRDSCTATNIASFDHLVGALLEQRRHVQAERLGGLEVDRQHILGR